MRYKMKKRWRVDIQVINVSPHYKFIGTPDFYRFSWMAKLDAFMTNTCPALGFVATVTPVWL